VEETTELPARRAPVLQPAKAAGHAYLILDGTLIPIERVAAARPFYSGKRRRQRMNVQVVTASDGELVWVSLALLRGSVHDVNVTWIWRILHKSAVGGWIVLADKGAGIVQCKTWRALRKLRCCPFKAGRIARALHVLQDQELQAVITG
jgi:hypothetical protein